MLRPLPIDLLIFLTPVTGCLLGFLSGRFLHRLPRICRVAALTVALAIILAGGLCTFRSLPDPLEDLLAGIGGPITILGLAILLILGFVWDVPDRRFSSTFLGILAAVPILLIAIEYAGHLWWRWLSPQTWTRRVDEKGCLRQSSGLTCAPAAAVMLLHRHGVSASEGEMAYLAGTSLFGTDAHSTARALRRKLAEKGKGAEVLRGSSIFSGREGEEFITHVQGPFLGHALVIVSWSSEQVNAIDPLDGHLRRMSRGDFEKVWDGTAIRVVDEKAPR